MPYTRLAGSCQADITSAPFMVWGEAWFWAQALPPLETCPSRADRKADTLVLWQLQVGMCPTAYASTPILPLALLTCPSQAQLSQ